MGDKNMRVGVVDYEAGNLRSVETALRALGADFITSGVPEDLTDVERLIFPGVGEAASAMDVLRERRLSGFLVDYVESGRPLLGICLGYQVLMEHSDERDTECLGVLPGRVKRFQPAKGLKIPHMGWNTVEHRNRHPAFTGIPEHTSFYFVHSYYVEPASQELVIGRTDYGIGFASAASRDNVLAVQFHPEKSGRHGLRLLRNFLTLGTV